MAGKNKPKLKKILLLSKYGPLGASSRLRSYQYLPYLRDNKWVIIVKPLFDDQYIQALYQNKPRLKFVITSYFSRLVELIFIYKYDFIWIEKEIFPYLPALFEKILNVLNIPYLVDYDDAIFHGYEFHSSIIVRNVLNKKISRVMSFSNHVTVGNNYLSKYASNSGADKVSIIPTVVDLDKYKEKTKSKDDVITIGWIGSPVTSHYLIEIKDVIERLTRNENVQILTVGVGKDQLVDLPIVRKEWSEKSEVDHILKMDIGIMPLKDSPWERGKCGYKLIQYMACGLPVIASPVGVNKVLVKHGVTGYLASGIESWMRCLLRLINNRNLRFCMGRNGRNLVEAKYSLQVQAPRLNVILEDIIFSEK